MKEYWTWLASLMGVFAFCQPLVQAIFPPELRFATTKLLHRLFHCLSPYVYFDITEIDGVSSNELYNAVQLYLSSSASVAGSRLSLTRALNSSAFTFGLSNNDRLSDTFNGATALWEHIVTPRQPQGFSWRPVSDEKRGFTLRIKKQDKPLILHPYLDHIMDRAAELRRRNQDRLLYTNSRGGGSMDSRGNPWESVPFKHPSTFDTLAIDPVRKDEILADLRDFAAGEQFYQRTGRAWKRGYLLYGPPGTGKSSMIAAMANYLRYDIYDLELTEVNTNSELRKLLMKTSSKSIIVIEDIDCSINLSNRQKPKPPPVTDPTAQMRGCGPDEAAVTKSITLSGLLNFTDGLWSCCGSERIFVFTTNHAEKLDPALLRSGRMDMHINLSYCTFPALKILIGNYLGKDGGDELDEGLMMEVEEVIDEAKMTPADISEVLIKNRRREKQDAVKELLDVLKGRIEGRVSESVCRGDEVVEEQEKRALESPIEQGNEAVEVGGGKGKGDEE